MLNKFKKLGIILGSFLLVCLFLTKPALAITDKEQLLEELKQKMNQLQEQIGQYEGQIQESREKAKSLANEISILENQISMVELEMAQTELAIQGTVLNINQIQRKIDDVQSQIDHQKELLSEYIRLIDQYGQETLLEIILKKEKFSDFFEEVNALENVQERIYYVLEDIYTLKSELEEQRQALEDQRDDQYQLKAFQEIQKNTVVKNQLRKEYLFNETKGQEKLYQEKIVGTEKDIEFIKKQISLLEKYHLTLEQAITNAVAASTRTGIRASFLLGVLEIESRLGINVGTGNWQKDMYQCYRSLGKISQAEKEKNAFLGICQELGLNPDLQPVSAEPSYGCGGAMGPAQFMPTTWLAYKEQIANVTGHQPPNPWDILDSFTAAAIKLAKDGANQRTYDAEHRAARIYIAGGRYQGSTAYRYGNLVMSQAEEFERELFR